MSGSMQAADPTARVAVDRVEALFRSESVRLIRLAAFLGADDPEDVVQEAFLKYARARGVRPDGEIRYLNRIVVNETRDRARVGARRGRLRLVDDGIGESAEELAGRRDEHRRVLLALERIGGRQREALVLRFWSELAYAEIAEVMGVRSGTAKSLVSRGLVALDKELEGTR